MWRTWFILEHSGLYWMCEVVFSSALHRQRAHRSLRADRAASWWVYTCPIIHTTPKEPSEGRTKQTKAGRRTGRQSSTLRVDISLHTPLKPTKATAINPTKTGTLPALVHPSVLWHHFYLGKWGEPEGPYGITALAEASQSPPAMGLACKPCAIHLLGTKHRKVLKLCPPWNKIKEMFAKSSSYILQLCFMVTGNDPL